MWNDIETTTDYLHFSVVSETIADLIVESGENPISIGISGSWGSGKSSMVKMVGKSLEEKDSENETSSYVFIEFNAWLYQGYEDAKVALLQVVAQKLENELNKRSIVNKEKVKEKLGNFIKRVNWFQVTKLSIPLLAGLIPGVSAFGPIINLANAINSACKDPKKVDQNTDAVESAFNDVTPEIKDLLQDGESKSATQQIDKIRKEFEDLLEEMKITLVVLVDDLDRCLPETAISTLEAMRLLLFVRRTAFIIAADEQMIRNGVKAHFGDAGLSDGLVTSYFDKLIQVPITVPHLGIAEIKVYIVLLFLESEFRRKKIQEMEYKEITAKMQKLLSNVWSKEITVDSINECFGEETLKIMHEYIAIADQLARLLVVADNIKGNPRLIKRFLNALEIRKKIAKINGMTLDSNLLIKMLLFERCASSAAFEYFAKEIHNSKEGKPEFIKELENECETGEKYSAPDTTWNTEFIENWIKLSPKLSDIDLRPILFLSRDRSMPIATYEDLSPEGLELFEALKQIKSAMVITEVVEKLRNLSLTDLQIIFKRMIAIGRNNQWDNNSISAIIHVIEADENFGAEFASVLAEIPYKSIKPTMIPLITNKSWASEIIQKWNASADVSAGVKTAITQHMEVS